MSSFFKKHRYLLARRTTQFSILFAYFGANYFGWNTITGNLSTAKIFNTIPLTDPYTGLQMFFAGAILTTDIIMGVGVVLFFYSLIGGRFFCSWVCPINVITETATYFRKKLPFQKSDFCSPIPKSTRIVIFFIGLILSFIFSLAAYEMVNPIGIAHRGIIFGFGVGWVILISIFLFDLFSQEYGWCGHICPVGFFNGAVGKYSFVKITHDASKCVNSDECFKVCPEVQILNMVGKESTYISGFECIKCARCIESCETDAFKFSIISYTKQFKGR